MDENIMNVVAEEMANNDVQEAVAEAAKSFDWMQFGVKGFFGLGVVTFIGGGIYVGKKLVYDKFIKPKFKKKAVDAPAPEAANDTETEEEVLDLTEEKSDNKD